MKEFNEKGFSNAILNRLKSNQAHPLPTKGPAPVSLGSYIYTRSSSFLIIQQTTKDRFIRFCTKLEQEKNLLPSDMAGTILNFLRLPQVGNYSKLTEVITDWQTANIKA